MTFDSDEELYLYWYFLELQEKGYILEIKRGKTYLLSDKIFRQYIKKIQLKTKVKIEVKDLIIMEDHVYTPDYEIVWAEKAKGLFYLPLQGLESKTKLAIAQVIEGKTTSIIEVKPIFDAQNMTRLFTLNKKWMFQIYGLYVTKLVHQEIFEATFTPVRYLFTNKSKGVRKIDFKVKTLEEYLK